MARGSPAWIRARRLFVVMTDALVGSTLLLIVVLATVQVVARYLFNVGIPWANESARFLFIWLVMLGSGAASARAEHLAFDMVLYRLRGRSRGVGEAVIASFGILFLAIVAWEGFRLVGLNAGQHSPVLGLSMSIVYLAVPLGAVLCLVGMVLAYVAGPEPSTFMAAEP